jgi:hypothetical protein
MSVTSPAPSASELVEREGSYPSPSLLSVGRRLRPRDGDGGRLATIVVCIPFVLWIDLRPTRVDDGKENRFDAVQQCHQTRTIGALDMADENFGVSICVDVGSSND